MGKLKRLELFNFKSYKGHHVLQFGDSYFTSIIGPNGSGKSNSMDAISFVLGIKSSHLRSSQLRDLVYRGRVLRTSKIGADGGVIENGTSHTNGFTQADEEEPDTQITGSQRNDPQSAWVMAVYEDDAGEEQKWKRSITSTHISEYRINNRVVTSKQYNDALENENILIKARNFLVFQGDVEHVANQAPKDITRMIEQISGSIEYEKDYENLKKEMEKTSEDQVFKLKQRRGLNSEIKQYQEQKREVESFQMKQQERDQAVVNQVLWKLFHCQRVIEESRTEIRKHQEEIKEHRRGVTKFEQKLEDARKEQAKVSKEVSKADRDIKQKDKEIEDKRNALVPVEEKISVTTRNVESYQKRVAEISKDRDKQETSVKKLTSDLAKVEKARDQWEADFERELPSSGRVLNKADLKEYQQLRLEVSKQTGFEQSSADELKRQLRTNEETANNLRTKVESAQEQYDKFSEEIKDLESRYGDMNSQAAQVTKSAKAARAKVSNLQAERHRVQSKLRELHEKINTLNQNIMNATDGQQESKKEQENKTRAATLKRNIPGVRGRLCDLCKPKQKKFETAVGMALGRYVDALVVDTDEAGKACIDYVRSNQWGQRTVIPLDSIQITTVDSNLKGMHKGMRLAVDAIDCDSDIERAVMYACGNTIICDDIDIAKQLVYRQRVNAKAVALDGTIIHKGGNMTGGRTKDDHGARRFNEAEVDNWRRMEEKYREESRELETKLRADPEEERLTAEIVSLESQSSFLKEELKALQRNVDSKKKQLEFAKRSLGELKPKHEEAAGIVERLKTSLQGHEEKVNQVEDKAFKEFCKRLGYSNIREYEARSGSLTAEADQKRRDFAVHVGKLKNQLNFERSRYEETKERVQRMESRAKSDQRLLDELEAEKEEILSRLDELVAAREQLEENLEKLRERNAEKTDKVAEQRRELQKYNKRMEDELRSISVLEGEVQRSASTRYTILRKCKIEEVNIPLAQGSASLDSLPLQDSPGAVDAEDAMDVDETDAALGATEEVRDYGIDVDFDSLDDELKEDESPQQETNLQEAISAITAELEKMAPNMRAIERLEGTEARAKTTDREFAAARTAYLRAKEDFEEVKEKRQELFNKAFDHIAEQIGTVYKELTRSVAAPQGGQAYLDKEDDEEAYLSGLKYHAMPPLKRFRDMEHLSGGEKTMAALALLFAVHSYQPSPFFVLDEVDAALDNANVAKIANYVRDHAGPGMQFIVISLKAGFFERSETLVGVMRDQAVNSSRTLTLDLRKYQEVAVR